MPTGSGVPILAANANFESEMPEPAPQDTAGYVYVLGTRTKRGIKTYVGWTLDPERRLAQHNAGTGAKSTRGFTWALLHVERHDTPSAAMSREWHLKRDRRMRSEIARRLTEKEPR